MFKILNFTFLFLTGYFLANNYLAFTNAFTSLSAENPNYGSLIYYGVGVIGTLLIAASNYIVMLSHVEIYVSTQREE